MESTIKWQTGEINDDGYYLVTNREGRVYVLCHRKGSIFSDSLESVIAWCPLSDIEPYKEETMEEIKVDIPKGYEFARVDENTQQAVFTKIQPQYPKTYEECCKIIQSDPNFYIDTHLYSGTLEAFYKLIICRNAYWKLYGEQTGLGKPWEPDWADTETDKYVIEIVKNTVTIHGYPWNETNHLLAFPTKGMRDAFYENFKDLIIEYKKLL